MTKNRRNVYLSDPQKEYLEAEGKRLGISVTELLRRIIDQHREEQTRSAKLQGDLDFAHSGRAELGMACYHGA